MLICVLDSPRLYGDQQDLVFSSVLNSTVSLSLAVMVFPEFTDISAEFVWTRPGGQRLSENINISYTSIIPEVFQSTLQIDNVAEGDYGYYIAMVHSASFIITLEKTGQSHKYLYIIAVKQTQNFNLFGKNRNVTDFCNSWILDLL